MNSKETYVGVSTLELLTIVFVVLKLAKVISWSWWWILSPIWIQVIVVLVVILICVLVDILKKCRRQYYRKEK